jgi:hypothetical protein
MRPIDTIREKLDSDFRKYKSTSLCKIVSDEDIKCIRGVGLCAIVSPLNPYNLADPDMNGIEHTFVVFIVNRPLGWFEDNISSKYFVLTINAIQDSPGLSIGFLVPSTILDDVDAIRKGLDPSIPDDQQAVQMADGDPRGIESHKFDFLTTDGEA